MVVFQDEGRFARGMFFSFEACQIAYAIAHVRARGERRKEDQNYTGLHLKTVYREAWPAAYGGPEARADRNCPTVSWVGLVVSGAQERASVSQRALRVSSSRRRAILSATSAMAPRNFPPLLSCVVDQITSPSPSTSRTDAAAS